MKIAVDFDEVIADTLKQVIKYYNSKHSSNFKFRDFFSYSWWEVWGGTEDEAVKVWFDFCDSDYYKKTLPLKGAVKSLENLAENNEIIIITSRPEKLRKNTEFLIKKFFGDSPFKIIFTDEFLIEGVKTKADFCIELKIPVILEDDADYSIQCAEAGVRVLLFDKPWNKLVSHKNIVRVSDWKEALKVISSINNT